MKAQIISLTKFRNLVNRMDASQLYDQVVLNVIHSLNSGNTDPLRVLLESDSIRDRRYVEFKANENGRILLRYLQVHAKGLVRLKKNQFVLRADREPVDIDQLPSVMDWYQQPVESPEDKESVALKSSVLYRRLAKLLESVQTGIAFSDAVEAHDLLQQIQSLKDTVLREVQSKKYNLGNATE